MCSSLDSRLLLRPVAVPHHRNTLRPTFHHLFSAVVLLRRDCPGWARFVTLPFISHGYVEGVFLSGDTCSSAMACLGFPRCDRLPAQLLAQLPAQVLFATFPCAGLANCVQNAHLAVLAQGKSNPGCHRSGITCAKRAEFLGGQDTSSFHFAYLTLFVFLRY